MSHWVEVNDVTIERIRRRLTECVRLLEIYSWVVDSFVLDFFLDSHWSHLPESWCNILKHCSPQTLASLLDPNIPADQKQVSDFKFVKAFLDSTVLNERASKKSKQDSPKANFSEIETGLKVEDEQNSNKMEKEKFCFFEDMLSVLEKKNPTLKQIFRKHVKPKKQYELARLGKFTYDILNQINVNCLIDVGSGQGHLARYLCYSYSLQVACVDSNKDFTDSARKFDIQLEQSFRKLERRGEHCLHIPHTAPVHVNAWLQPVMDLQAFHSILSEKFHIYDTSLRYCILGLHTCGDLGPVLIKMYAQDTKATVLNSIGCCYMKIKEHFPMSLFLRGVETRWKLNYTNAELACHAIEMYTERLREGEEDKLKVHCYRAVLEKFLMKKDPALKHSILRTVSRAHTLTFLEYAVKATSKLPLGIDPLEFDTEEIREELSAWWEVVGYYTLRLALAPILETVILLDRCVFLYENGFRSLLIPLFDPIISPRNQLIFSAKN
ncbi:protein RRNAD1 isoform X2 [Eurytemora carolleeae]|uniref:protein RRNAD1 isoform X2 n=1 Tax=Eurytemora carolleeae TaxID=1294199 RepID=UPI000C77AC78|nr:protein RRNAD1 isoform X2 [Eurytemora carolleeae]|eukprot:XP_023345260.1 protein RRNAD1-like isoform X2 [Eurytemora affinis]